MHGALCDIMFCDGDAMKNAACYIISGLLAAAFVSGMVMNARADEDSDYYQESYEAGNPNSEEESVYYFESSLDDESSFYYESSNEEESSYYFESSNEEESSYYFESSSEEDSSYYFESSSEEESSYYYESSNEEESSHYYESSSEEESGDDDEQSENQTGTVSDADESSIPEEVVRVPYIPRNDPLGWLNSIETVIPSDKLVSPSGDVRTEVSVFDESASAEQYTAPEVSSVSVDTVTRRVTSEDVGKDSKTAFLIGLIVFSLIGMIATLSLIAFLRSKGMFAPSFLKFESKKK